MSEDVIGVRAILDLLGWSPNIKKVIDDTDKAEKSMGEMAKTFNDKLKVAENSIGAVTAAVVVFEKAIGQGESILQGKALFTAMAGGAQQAAAGEAELARTTRGLVDDQVAMAGASKLMSLGLADNAQQAADLVGVGAQLGRVFMGDAGAGINAFNQIMANESPRGLAQFGISVDAVQKKMKDLEAQGYSTRDAFRLAVLDEARGKLDQLGDSVVMAGSALDRLKIQVDDFKDNILENAAVGFEGIVHIAQFYAGTTDEQIALAEQHVHELHDAVVTAAAETQQDLVNYITLQGDISGAPSATPNMSNQNLQTAVILQGQQEIAQAQQLQLQYGQLLYERQDAYNQKLQNTVQIYEQGNLARAAEVARQNESLAAEDRRHQESMRAYSDEQRAIYQVTIADNRLEQVRAAAATAAIRNANLQAAADNAEYANLERVRAAAGEAQAAQQAAIEAQAQAGDQIERQFDTITNLSQQVTNIGIAARGSFQGQGLFTDQQAFNAREMADAARSTLQALEEKAAAFPDLVKADDLTRMRQLVSATDTIAQNAQRGAKAFDSMRLTELLGQTSGGPAGEIVNQVDQFLQNSDLSVDRLQQIQQAMELVTGQQTDASVAMTNDIVPALAEIAQGNATAAAQSALAIQNYAQAQALAGQAVTEAGMLAAGGLGVNPNAGSQQITVTAGQTATQAAQANNITVDQLLATTGALNVNSVPVGTFTMNGGTAVLPLQGPGTVFGGGEGVLAQQQGLIAPPGEANTGPGAPLINGQTEITDAATNVQTAVTTTESVVSQKTVAMESHITVLNTTGQTQLTGPTGLTNWWDQLQTKVTDVYNAIMPWIREMQQGMTEINQAAQNLSATPPGLGSPPNPITGHGLAGGGPIASTSMVGEHGPELYTPSRSGYIVNAANTESILSALAGVLNSGGGNHVNNNQRTATFNQYVTVQGNAQAASALLGVTDALRGFG